MKLKIYQLEKGPMVLTGSKVLELIQDNYTPPMDLLVRESIQNSADAILKNKNFGKIAFKTGVFSCKKFAALFEKIGDNILSYFTDDRYDYLAIIDSNTCGLLGEPVENTNGEPNNLYNLVYDIMNRKTGTISGGSHGIGKSIYYRYGIGVCIFYSRTFENGEYKNKLAAALIQDETKENCLLGNNTSGIAYFGDLIDGKTSPVYMDSEINEFLSVFDVKMFTGEETGTAVIIPFINKQMMLSNIVNDDNDLEYWINDFETCLVMAIQRWYFARLNNENFNGKYLKVAVNNSKIELNPFYSKLQELYNGAIENATVLEVSSNKMPGITLGKFYYKVFKNDELGMVPPNNLPSPKYLTDSPYEVDEKGLLFYMRKPGMVVNYSNSKFGSYFVDENSYLIGVFVLNDEATLEGENLGGYIRKSEEANHKEWNDINSDKYPLLKTKKPFKQICSCITKKLTEEFKQSKAVNLDGGNTILQRKLGEKLMPPSGFGKEAEPKTISGSHGGSIGSKDKKVKITFKEISSDGSLIYEIETIIKSKETVYVSLAVKAGGRSYSFEDWEKMEFSIPCTIERIDITGLTIEKNKKNYPQNIPLDESFTKRKKKIIEDEIIYKVRGVATVLNNPCGIKINNFCEKKITTTLKIAIKPVDYKYEIGLAVDYSMEVL